MRASGTVGMLSLLSGAFGAEVVQTTHALSDCSDAAITSEVYPEDLLNNCSSPGSYKIKCSGDQLDILYNTPDCDTGSTPACDASTIVSATGCHSSFTLGTCTEVLDSGGYVLYTGACPEAVEQGPDCGGYRMPAQHSNRAEPDQPRARISAGHAISPRSGRGGTACWVSWIGSTEGLWISWIVFLCLACVCLCIAGGLGLCAQESSSNEDDIECAAGVFGALGAVCFLVFLACIIAWRVIMVPVIDEGKRGPTFGNSSTDPLEITSEFPPAPSLPPDFMGVQETSNSTWDVGPACAG